MTLTSLVLLALVPTIIGCGAAVGPPDAAPSGGSTGPASADLPGAEPVAPTGRVRVTVKGFRNRDGQALMSIFAGPAGFPDEGDRSMQRVSRPIAADAVEVTFEGVPPGEYAVAVLHDEDMDFKMRTGLFGIPKEGYGVSNNATGRFGPPKFGDAAFRVAAARDVRLTITMIYH